MPSVSDLRLTAVVRLVPAWVSRFRLAWSPATPLTVCALRMRNRSDTVRGRGQPDAEGMTA